MNRIRSGFSALPTRLRGWVLTVPVLGLLLAAGSAGLADRAPDPVAVVAATGLIAAAKVVQLRIRIGSERTLFGWGEVALVLVIGVLAPVWITPVVLLGGILGQALTRTPVVKIVYNATSQAVAAAGAAAVIAVGAGGPVSSVNPRTATVVCLSVLTYVVIATVLAAGAVAAANGSRLRGVVARGMGITGLMMVGNTAFGLLVISLGIADLRWLVAVPPLLWLLNEAYKARLRAGEERRAWQELAAATQELNLLDQQEVLAAAVRGACRLFSPNAVEIICRETGCAVVGTPQGGLMDRSSANLPEVCGSGYVVARPLVVAGEAIGELRLWFMHQLRLSHREHLALSAFADVLGAALRNATTHARLRDMAERKAYEAEHDPLTGLANRTRLLEYGESALRSIADPGPDIPRSGVESLSSRPARTVAVMDPGDRADPDDLPDPPDQEDSADPEDPVDGTTDDSDVASAVDPSGSADHVALVLLDLNRFKDVNDALGHCAGDRLLQDTAQRLTSTVKADELLARLGGDEFALMITSLPGSPSPVDHAVARGRDLVDTLSGPTEVAGVPLSIEASVGVVTAPVGTCDMTELLRRADVAMYQAKRTGQGIAAYDPGRDAASTDRLALAAELREALEVDDQLVLALQPAVDLATGAPVGAEALVRWHHPRRGLLLPSEFIGVVEQSELVTPFTRYVVDRALGHAASWAREGLDVPVAVNLSARSLLDRRLPGEIAELLGRHNVAPEQLVLEITETVMMTELDVIDDVLGGLREIGAQLAVDDFGTGYSSLTFLARFPVHEVKVDRGFVAKMADSPEARAIVRSTVELARALDLRVVAEGVETAEQRSALAEMGCDAAQGYHFFAPLPAEQTGEVLRDLVHSAEARSAQVIPLASGASGD